MSDEKSPRADAQPLVTRRAVVGMLAASAGAGLVINALPLIPSSGAVSRAAVVTGSVNAAVVSIHMDLPYIDGSGTAVPYVPPSHAGRYEQLSALSVEEEARWLYNC
jgi:hypothetical protein